MRQEPAPPRADVLELGPTPYVLRDACLVSCESGVLRVGSNDGDCMRLGEGDLLRVGLGAGCRARAAGAQARVRVFTAGPDWVRFALGLAGCDAGLSQPFFSVERAASDGARRARRIFEELAIAAAGEDRGRRLRETALRLELLALALEPPPLAPSQGGPRRANRCRTALSGLVSALREASLEEVSLASLAHEVGLSERQFSRLFREEFGTTFRDHLATLRLDRAKRLLAGTDLPVIEVAGHTGWSSLAHFNAVFRRRVGVTPSAFRGGGFAFPTP